MKDKINSKTLLKCNTCIMSVNSTMYCESMKFAVALFELKKEIPIIKNYIEPPICIYYEKEEK